MFEKLRLTWPEGELFAERVTVPLNDPWLLTVMVEVNLDLPFWLFPVKKLGLALMVKVAVLKLNVTRAT